MFTRTSKFKAVLWTISGIAVSIAVALGYGLYVYQSSPVLVWGLLFLCWACFRLHLSAQRKFAHRSHPASEKGSSSASA